MEIASGVAGALAGEVGKSSFGKVRQQFGYLVHYQSHIVKLQEKQNELKEKMDEANLAKETADKKFQQFFPRVLRWLKETQELHQKAEEFLHKNKASPSCSNGNCRNPWSCYSLGRKAWKMTEDMIDKIKEAPDFGATFNTPPTLASTFNLKDIKEFDSRRSLMDEVLKELKEGSESIIGICGTAGVGKTTMVNSLVQRVQKEKLFDEIAMTTVSQNPHLQRVQEEIIELLGIKIDDNTLPKRATLLSNWLNYGKRTLLILDDVWEELDFEAIGLPKPMSKGCKIVLTSRKEDVCMSMGSRRNFPISLLTETEAWDLFREMAGNTIEELDLEETAKEIANECDRLPMAVVTVAKALQDKPRPVWNDSLLQLQKSNIQSIPGMDKVYSRIQLSYDLLKDKEAQSCFRLCCLYPEDYNVPMEDLVIYGMGLGLFENVANLNQARDRVDSIIYKMKKSYLLLDGEKDECVKMHDLVRDFAISITSKEKGSFVVGCDATMERWPESNRYKTCRAISLVCNEINEHPVKPECPNVELLQILSPHYSAQFPLDFFGRMKKLKAVSLAIPSLLESLDTLKKLKTLRVKETGYRWKETSKVGSLLGGLTNLEILSVSTNGRFNDFPMEIGKLANLRLLDFSGTGLAYIPPGVLSQMVKLEELYLPLNFIRWGCKERERTNASLTEVESLRLINSLQIGLQKGSVLAEDFVKNLIRFNVYLGSYYSPDFASVEESKEMLEVFDVDACDVEGSWIIDLLRKSRHLRLMRVTNLKNIMYLLKGNGFRQMKKMYISDCHDLEYLINTRDPLTNSVFSQLKSLSLHHLSNLKEIWHDDQEVQLPVFIKLDQISIVGCGKLKHMFPLSMAREMRQLRSIDIRSCDEMEVIFCHGNKGEKTTQPPTSEIDEMIETIAFPQLNMLKLVKVPKLAALCDTTHTIEFPSLESVEFYSCDNLKTCSKGLLSHPMLKEIQINKGCYLLMEDLNATMKESLKDEDNLQLNVVAEGQ